MGREDRGWRLVAFFNFVNDFNSTTGCSSKTKGYYNLPCMCNLPSSFVLGREPSLQHASIYTALYKYVYKVYLIDSSSSPY